MIDTPPQTATTDTGLSLGIDAGGTRTRWALADAAGTILAEGEVAGLSALQTGNQDGREA
jgi:glucosamine kinase